MIFSVLGKHKSETELFHVVILKEKSDLKNIWLKNLIKPSQPALTNITGFCQFLLLKGKTANEWWLNWTCSILDKGIESLEQNQIFKPQYL